MVLAKSKGNGFERKIAKELSIWMFNDENVLKRTPSSGADKCILCGDIMPMKQMDTSWHQTFPFLIECKTGYDSRCPSFWSYDILTEWIKKLHTESKVNNQNLILLICQFKSRKKIIITNHTLDMSIILPHLVFPVIYSGLVYWHYMYMYKDMLNIHFDKLYPNVREKLCSMNSES